MNKRAAAAAMALSLLLLHAPPPAGAQWVFVARKALGRIEQMTQPEDRGVPGYDVATVVLEGKADKVYETALKTIRATPKLRVTRSDPERRIIDFNDGARSAGLKISQVNDEVVHLMIASAILPGQPSETSLVLAGVIRVCKEMGVDYSIAR